MSVLAYQDIALSELIQERLGDTLSSIGDMDAVLGHVLARQGKMIRPRLVALSTELCGGQVDKGVFDVASGVEMVHMASLVHDDIIDNSPLRRGRPSLGSEYSPQVAVLAGDFLFASAFSIFANSGNAKILMTMTDTIRKMCEGEVNQLLSPLKTETAYWDYVYRKTACLIGASCRLGAILAGQPSSEEALEKFGEYIGYAFQLVDDLLDYTGDSSVLGKKPGEDFKEGLWTLPTLRGFALGVLPENWREHMTFEEVRYLLDRLGVFAEVFKEAKGFVAKAKEIITQFPMSSPHEAMTDLCDFIVSRQA